MEFIFIGLLRWLHVTCRDQINSRIPNGVNYININLDDYQVYDPYHQDMFQQTPGVYLPVVRNNRTTANF